MFEVIHSSFFTNQIDPKSVYFNIFTNLDKNL